MSDSTELPGSSVQVPFERVGDFTRHLTHDVRNALNGMDLQAAYAVELITDPEAIAEVKKIRAMISSTARLLQTLSSKFWVGQPNVVKYSARMVAEDFRDRVAKLLPESAGKIEWSIELHDEAIHVDLEMFVTALSELCRNALQFQAGASPITARFFGEGGRFQFELREVKAEVASPPAQWGREPLRTTHRSGFGLGLYHVRALLAAHRGELAMTHDPAAALLITRVTLPLASTAET